VSGDVFYYVAAIAIAGLMVFVVAARRRQHEQFIRDTAENEVCEHLRPAFELLKSRGLAVVRAGQRTPDMPLEIHMSGPFDPAAVYDESKLAEPALVSERRVLYCREDWCEIHPGT
jgi:hypothetical protein